MHSNSSLATHKDCLNITAPHHFQLPGQFSEIGYVMVEVSGISTAATNASEKFITVNRPLVGIEKVSDLLQQLVIPRT